MNSYREWDNKAKLVVGWISHKEQINYDNFKQANGQSRIISVYDGIRQYDHTQITSKGNKLARRQPAKEPLEIDQYVGNQGIAPESDLVIVNWEKNRFYPSDAIRAIRFIIDQTRAVEGNVVIYFPFPIKNQQQRKLIQSIVGDQRLNRQIMMVNNRDQLAHLICPTPLLENARTVEYAYEFAEEDDVIDVFIIYNSFNIEPIITTPDQTNLYPLVFPYLGARGTAREIKQLINDYLGQMVIGSLAPVLGNEPFDMTPTEFKPGPLLNVPLPLSGAGILIGIIDTGIDYTNPLFIDEKGQTRIEYIWDQTIGNSSPFGYGTIYDRETINQALKSPDPLAIVPHQDEIGHGTMLAGIAAGYHIYEKGMYKGGAPNVRLVIVKLAPASLAMQEIYYGQYSPFGFSGLDIARAVQYVTNMANHQKKPIAICLPSGTNTGSHDGASVLDEVLKIYGQNTGVSMIVPAGEEANKGHHASGNLKQIREQEVKLVIPKGQKGFMVEIWAGFGDRLMVSLMTPKVEGEVGEISLNKPQTYSLPGTSFVWVQGSKIDVDTGCQVIRFRFNDPVAGEWTIGIKGVVVLTGQYNIWLPKTGMILPETILSPADPFTTIYSTSAADLITVGCYDEMSQSSTASSGRGLTRDNRVKPDFMVNSVNVLGPMLDNKWGLMTGTSTASAIATGVAALIYEEQIKQAIELANTTAMRAILVANVDREATIDYPNPSIGYGLLDINQPFIIKDVTG